MGDAWRVVDREDTRDELGEGLFWSVREQALYRTDIIGRRLHWGGGCISRFTPTGERERSIALPAAQITNICFAGRDLDRMFVTSAAEGRPFESNAGALFEVETGGVRGLAPSLFDG